MDKDMAKLVAYAVGSTALAIATLTGIAVLSGYKEVESSPAVYNTSNASQLITNATYIFESATVDKFIAGLVVFGTFLSIIVLTLVGKIIMNLFSIEK